MQNIILKTQFLECDPNAKHSFEHFCVYFVCFKQSIEGLSYLKKRITAVGEFQKRIGNWFGQPTLKK